MSTEMLTYAVHVNRTPINLADYSEPWCNLEVGFNVDLEIEVCHSSHYDYDDNGDECIVFEIWKDVDRNGIIAALHYSTLDGFYDNETDTFIVDTHTNGWKGYYVSDWAAEALNQVGSVTLTPIVGFEESLAEAVERYGGEMVEWIY